MLKSILKSIAWNSVSVFISLLQIIALLFYVGIFKINFNYGKLFSEGSLLFFCTSLMVSVVLEYYTEKQRAPKIFEGVYFIAIPIISIFLITIIYCGLLTMTSYDIGEIKQITVIFIVFSVLYSVIYKSIKFYKWS